MSVLQDPSQQAPEFEVPGTPYKLLAMGTVADREVDVIRCMLLFFVVFT